MRRVDRSFGWSLSRAVPMVDASGAIHEWIGAASDTTERKAAEEKLREADRRKDELLAMLAHERRNPLAPIGAAAELLQLARRLRALPETAEAMLVAVTGYGQARDRDQILAAGFDHHLVKPIDTGRLYALLGACCHTAA